MSRAWKIAALLAVALAVRIALEFIPSTPVPRGTPYPACTPGIEGCPMSGVRE